jgi:hypothetical protein
VRNKEATEKQLEADDLLGKNVTIFKADMTDRPANEVVDAVTLFKESCLTWWSGSSRSNSKIDRRWT